MSKKKKYDSIGDFDLSTSPNFYRENMGNNNRNRDRERNIFCGNCGNLGHTYRRCTFPVTSCGIILFKINEDYVKNDLKDGRYKFLLIQRKDTLGYVEFLRGKYEEQNKEYITKLLETMTFSEIEKISKHTFDELWNMLWLNKKIKQYQTEYDISKGKFENLKKGKYYLLSELISNSNISYVEREWGFPKGRRNLRETDYDCAIREFEEESGLKKDEYEILRNIRPVEEIFYGSNNIRYKHIYYIAESKLNRELEMDPKNKHQRTEIGNIGWFTLNEALLKIRPYNKAKKDVLIKVNKLLINNNC